jgi:hypothetical protein
MRFGENAMSGTTRGDYRVGRGRPPKHTRWKKGQTGNPRRIRKPKSLDVAKMIEAAFRKKIHVTQANSRRRMTVFEAIVLQLMTKARKKDMRAMRVFLDYQDFAVARGGCRELLVVRGEEA